MVKQGATFCRKEMAAAGVGIALVLSFLAPSAEARHWRGYHHARQHAHFEGRRHHEASIRHRHHHARPNGIVSKIAAIVVDGNSGRTLYARNENELRYPASITKVMTLYLLFEQLEKGRLRLDSNIGVSSAAAAQKPTKLGLRSGASIVVDDAIKAVVTRSANDIAVAIAEAIAGDEESFARLMTQKAHALGMNDTHFANASGLPHAEQVTTAHDLAILGRAIQERFPRYYHYFSTHVFYYGGAAIKNHNHLLDRVEGMDGIKTGYTHASGFNLLTSVKRDGHYIVAVVLGGPSAGTRDRIMADLIEAEIENGAAISTASVFTGENVNQPATDAAAAQETNSQSVPQTKIDSRLAYAPAPSKLDPALDPIRLASLNRDVPAGKPRPAFVSGAPNPEPALPRAAFGSSTRKLASIDGSTALSHAGQSGSLSTATPSTAARPRTTDKIAAVIESSPYGGLVKIANNRPSAGRNGWMIQIGATADATKAAELLVRAKSESRQALSGAQPFTEKIQKGSETLYRARFTGLEADSAERACKTLKRSGFSCFATKN